jgi:hypothetical protein
MSKWWWAAVVAVLLSAVPGMALSDEAAGHVLWLFGQVERVGVDGTVQTLAKDDAVYEGDLIRSAPGSSAQLIMRDEALIGLRAESSVKLAKYRYGGHVDGAERAIMELIRGGLRSVTGAIGRTNKDDYQLKHETHVIGIRGTDHETYVTDSGTFNRVTLGGTYLQTPDGRIDLAPGEVGFASKLPGSTPSRLQRTPEFMQFAALTRGNTGPQPRGQAPSDDRRLTAGSPTLELPTVSPALPAQTLGENSRQKGWSNGGRCDGPCVDPLKFKGRK